MKNSEEIKKNPCIRVLEEGADGLCGWIYQRRGNRMFFIASWGMGWEHVSISHGNRLPSWDEMCLARSIFWHDNECVVQYMQERKGNIMHLWRPVGSDIPVPPKILA